MVSPGTPSGLAALAGQLTNSLRIDGFATDPFAIGANNEFGGAIIQNRARIIGYYAQLGTSGENDTDLQILVNGVKVAAADITLASGDVQASVALSRDLEPGDVVRLAMGPSISPAAADLVVSAEILQRYT